MSYSCPMSFEKVDSNVSRFNSLFVSILVISYIVTFNVYILYFVFIDFCIKLFMKKEYSPIFIVARFIKQSFKLPNYPTDSGAKRLAAYFGLIFVSMLIFTHYLDVYFVSLSIAGVFLTCALLDVLINYCLGCKIYYIIKKIYPNFMT